MKISAFFAAAAVLPVFCGCAGRMTVPPIVCGEALMPRSEIKTVLVDKKDAKHGEISYLLNQFKSSSKSYNEYLSNDMWSTVSYIGSLAMFITAIMMQNAYVPDGDNPYALIPVGGSLGLVFFGSYKWHESKNNLLKSVYQYNNACECRKYKAGNGALAGDYFYPEQQVLGGVDFISLSGKRRFPYNSEEAVYVFRDKTAYRTVMGEAELQSGLSWAAMAGQMATNSLLGFVGYWLYDESMNNIFYLLDIVNSGCCTGK